jgi:hypothetical protein
MHVVLNGSNWWDDDAALNPQDRTEPNNASLCDSKTLDVKGTEANNTPLFGLLPFFPDIKRKARVEIQEAQGLTGLLPIAVRVPAPLSAAAVFYNEANGSILDVRYFRQVCTPTAPGCLVGAPPGLAQWTTEPPGSDPSPSWARFNVVGTTGVVVATSVRPGCGVGSPPAGPPCLEDSGWAGRPIDDFCRQAGGAVQCYDANGKGAAQAVQSGVQFIRGWGNADTGTGPPQLRSAYLDAPSSGCNAYFTSIPAACTARLNVAVDLGALLGGYTNPSPPPATTPQPLRASDVEVRYRLVRANGTSFCDYGSSCDLVPGSPNATGVVTYSTSGSGSSPNLPIAVASRGNAVSIQVRIRNSTNATDTDCRGSGYSNLCRWYYTASSISDTTVPSDAQILASPIQRSFMGELDRTGPLKWLRLTVDQDCDLATLTDRVIGSDASTGADAASQPAGAQRCYVVELGLAGGLARDQDEPPIALNLGSNSSERAYVDCDPNIANLKSEMVSGCGWPSYAANKFDTNPICPANSGFFMLPKADPFQNWPPFRCVLTQTGNSDQVAQGFNERLFGKTNNPKCPSDDATQWIRGRNYWHRDNNGYDDPTFAWDHDTPTYTLDDWGNKLRNDDPRLVTLFFTTYDSFSGTGNDVFPIVGFGNFYITGYGRTQNGGWQGGAPDDPCTSGNDGNLTNGNGNEPPPDLDYSKNTTWAWGHFVKDVQPAPFTTGGSGIICNPQTSFQPCVAVLVE